LRHVVAAGDLIKILFRELDRNRRVSKIRIGPRRDRRNFKRRIQRHASAAGKVCKLQAIDRALIKILSAWNHEWYRVEHTRAAYAGTWFQQPIRRRQVVSQSAATRRHRASYKQ